MRIRIVLAVMAAVVLISGSGGTAEAQSMRPTQAIVDDDDGKLAEGRT